MSTKSTVFDSMIWPMMVLLSHGIVAVVVVVVGESSVIVIEGLMISCTPYLLSLLYMVLLRDSLWLNHGSLSFFRYAALVRH